MVSNVQARVREAMRTHRLINQGDTVLVAVSGGVDSVALLLILHALGPSLGIELAVAHYDHGIRGQAAREDARYVQRLSGSLDLRCFTGHGDVPSLARLWRTSIEDAARRARYAYLDEIAGQIGAERIALAHHVDDQAETVLMHLVHGAGLEGLSAMRPLQGNRIRPLLGIARADIEAYVRQAGVAWREDATNADSAYTRNRLRHQVLPLLHGMNPKAAEAMARTAEICAQAVDDMQGLADSLLVGRIKRMEYGAFWDAGAGSMPTAAIRRFVNWAGVAALDAQQTWAIAELRPGATANLPGAWRALRTKTRLHLIAPQGQPPAEPQTIAWETPEGTGYGDGIREQVFDADRVAGAALRFRRPGDLFSPLGTGGTQRLKQTMRDAGIDRPFRDLVPVLAKGSRILWIVGVKPSVDAAVSANTRRVILARYQGDLPWEISPETD